jgi:hypothetical protein
MFTYKEPKDLSYKIQLAAGRRRISKQVEADDIAYGIVGIRKSERRWTLDHIPSGFKIGQFKTEANARQAVRELFEVTNFRWMTPPKHITNNVREILRRLA